MEGEILELLGLERAREPLSPGKRLREFQKRIQSLKNGDEVEVAGFLIGRKPPGAPLDGAYYLLSPIPPSELASLGKSEFRTYLVIRATEMTEMKGEVRPGSHVLVRGITDAYPWGNLRMVHAKEIEGRDYSDYWRDYSEFALSGREVGELFENTVYLRDDMRKALIYSLFGVPYTPLPETRSWGEGFGYTVYRYGEGTGLLALWKALKYFYKGLPWEVRLSRKRVIETEDPLLGIDFRLGNPNGSDVKYYTPLTKKALSALPKWVEPFLTGKRSVGLIPENREPNPRDALARISETPFVLVPWEEKPYFEESREFRQLLPNLLVTVFLHRAKVTSLGGEVMREFRERYIELREWGRREYGREFEVLSVPSSFLNNRTRYVLDARLFGAVSRFRGKPGRRVVREVVGISEAIINDWAVVIKENPEILISLEREYERYVPRDVRAQRALMLIYDIAATSTEGEMTAEEVVRTLVSRGFSRTDALELLERFIKTGYLYEPFPGKLKLVR
ncbi:hypothetical protein CL1_1526 [Thermococcus cleftensis]|uniref:Uncharacterized protein n=1 Tax=Thermococcus cleftensis (strain DSM 27260 / KACC 17922 / CL1) TaxID=163003 RepID=I3ZVJ1_THECF|nr:hypothetical protein [Thermococcus cleftensis]AFL95725.1 hypothetical protein CL1_1526 [Thermococcus cleftensis]